MTRTEFSSPRELVDYAKSLDCIHCGLCLDSCPTYRLSGVESSSPRGRIHWMRAVAEERATPDAAFTEEMDYCLVCRNCESVCPAGVQFGAMMEVTRAGLPRGPLARFARWVGFRHVLPSRRMLRLLATLLRIGQRTGALALVARLAGERGAPLRALPSVPPRRERRPLELDSQRPAERATESVALLEGCVMPELYGRVNRATVQALAQVGIGARTPRKVTCCGSLHAHNGDREGARMLARKLIEGFETLVDPDGAALPVVINSAGCGSHLRELSALFGDEPEWAARAERFSARVRDLSEVLEERGRDSAPSAAPSVANPVAWDDPCHLCHGQGVRSAPRVVLDRIAGLERVELERSESCCGSAGIYSMLRPADSKALLDEKIAALRVSGARTLVTANPGCQLQWESGVRAAGLDVRVMHLAEVVARASSEPSENDQR